LILKAAAEEGDLQTMRLMGWLRRKLKKNGLFVEEQIAVAENQWIGTDRRKVLK
jgi:hypothetical protein